MTSVVNGVLIVGDVCGLASQRQERNIELETALKEAWKSLEVFRTTHTHCIPRTSLPTRLFTACMYPQATAQQKLRAHKHTLSTEVLHFYFGTREI